MPSCFLPLSEVSAALVKAYLGRQGIAPEIVEWKYFDTTFNRSAERGYVLLRDGRVSGFLGAIPFTMHLCGSAVRTAWTCDWSADADAGAAGVLLIKKMLSQYDPYFQLGGNDNTLRIMPRLASFTALDAGILLYIPLRLGAWLRAARRRLPRVPLDSVDFLNRLPLSTAPAGSCLKHVRIEPGVSPALASVVVDKVRTASCYPQYSFEYIDWQVGRCPGIEATSVFVPAAKGVTAAALCWRQKPAGATWRLALWANQGAANELDHVLCAALRHIYDNRGEMAAALVSGADAESFGLLKNRRFIVAPRRRMFCVVSSDPGRKFEVPIGLSMLDTDMAYRFD